jgi:hypothetical protein
MKQFHHSSKFRKLKLGTLRKNAKFQSSKRKIHDDTEVVSENIIENYEYNSNLENCILMKAYSNYIKSTETINNNNDPRRIMKMISYTFYLHNSVNITDIQIESWTYKLFAYHSDLILKYVDYLKNVYRHVPATILNFMNTTMQTYIHFYTLVRTNCGKKYKLTCDDIIRLRNTCALVKKSCLLFIKRNGHIKTKKQRISERKLPSGNQIKKLHAAVRDVIPWATHMAEHPQLIDQNVYTCLLQVIIASIYTSPQGRIAGIQNLLYEDGDELLTSHAEGFRFKTAASLGIQNIILNSKAR